MGGKTTAFIAAFVNEIAIVNKIVKLYLMIFLYLGKQKKSMN